MELGTALSTTLQFSLVIRVEQLELGCKLDQLDRENRVCSGLLKINGITKAACGRVLLHTLTLLLRSDSNKT